MANKIITLRDRLAKGGIEGRVFALLPPSEFERVRHPLCPPIVNVYEAKGVVSCLTNDNKTRPYVLARNDRGYSVPKETWLYLPMEEALTHQEVTDIALPDSNVKFRRRPFDKTILEMPFTDLYLSDQPHLRANLGKIAEIYGHASGWPNKPAINKVADVLHYSPFDLGSPKGIGQGTINLLMAYLGQFGLGLRQE